MTDVRLAFRSLRKSPGFTTVAVLTLALGIGANTAIFSLVHAVVLKLLPYRDPSRLVVAWDTYLPQFDRLGLSITEFEALRGQSAIFEKAAWYRSVPQELALTAPDAEPLQIRATFASAELFPLLGVSPVIGHAFSPDQPAGSVLLGDALWRSRFHSDPAVVGRSVRLNGQDFTIVGVMPPPFRFPDFADVWLPNGPLFADSLTNPVRHALGFVGRLAPGVTPAQASTRLASISRQLAADHPKTSRGWAMKLAGMQEDIAGNLRPTLLLLWGAVALVLMIACANVANLLLSRATGRSREIAIRAALGAGAGRLLRQLLVEALVLAAMGGAIGSGLVWIALAVSPVPAPVEFPILLFAIATTLATGILFGIAPALQAVRSDHYAVIKSAAPASGRPGGIRAALVVAEFAFAIVLVAGAGILVKSFLLLTSQDPGFDPNHLLTVQLNIPPSRDPQSLLHRLREHIDPLPGVESVASVNWLPLTASRANSSRFHVPGSPLIDPNALPGAQVRTVSPGYFRTMRIPLLSGRDFTDRDLNDPVVIINHAFARRYWPGRDPVGEKFITGVWGTPSWSTIVGVVGDVKDFSLDSDPALVEYFPGAASRFLAIRTAAAPGSVSGAVRRAIHEVDSEIPIAEMRPMDDLLDASSQSRRWTMLLLTSFAGLALILALVGIYGVMSGAVARRTREIGIRIALGAGHRTVLRMVIGEALRLCGIGVALGLGAAFLLRRVMASFVFGVSPSDPLIYASVAGSILAVAVLASYVPARRAATVDAAVALKAD